MSGSVAAQAQSSLLPRGVVPFDALGEPGEERARVDQLTGKRGTAGWLARTSSSVGAWPADTAASASRLCALRSTYLSPRLDVNWSTALPVERNDGGVWAGRGLTMHATAGVRSVCGPIRIQFAPAMWLAENRPFPFVGNPTPARSGFASPFFAGLDMSADMPSRFGSEPLVVVEAGQTSIEVDARVVTVGASTESEWWGPGIRNALVISSHAAGIPRIYVRSSAPVRTWLGNLDGRWLVGALVESPYFDFDSANDLRSLSGAVVTLATVADTNLSLGIARVVFGPVRRRGALPARALDVFLRWGDGADIRDTVANGFNADQITSFFARWVFPASRFEAYAEWARASLGQNRYEWLFGSEGQTLGMQWVSGEKAPAWRIQGEMTNLEQRMPTRAQAPATLYSSPTVPQGYTHRGQTVGAMIGPGSSSQWFAVDRLGRESTLGGFVSRVRWANDAFYRAPTGRGVWAHDVSLIVGVRSSKAFGRLAIATELAAEKRLNYHFQSATVGFGEDDTFDVNNLTLRLSLEPRRDALP